MTPKQKAWKVFSRFIRLRDALDYCKKTGLDSRQFGRVEDIPVKCCTCGIVKAWIRMDAGHFISRGTGGSSGVYFDERNVHAQSKDCNAWKQGAPVEYEQFIIEKYGKQTVDELRRKHHIHTRKSKIHWVFVQSYYKGAYKKLIQENDL